MPTDECVSAGRQRSALPQRLSGEAERRLASQQRTAGEEAAGQRTARASQHQVSSRRVMDSRYLQQIIAHVGNNVLRGAD